MSSEREDYRMNLIDRAIATEKCPICNAKPGVKCGSIIDASKTFDVPHAARVALAKRFQ